MKNITNISIYIETSKVTYKELIKNAINNVPKDGFTIDDMKKRLRVLSVLEKEGDNMDFEDADYDIVKSCVNEQKWIVINTGLVKFVDTINSL